MHNASAYSASDRKTARISGCLSITRNERDDCDMHSVWMHPRWTFAHQLALAAFADHRVRQPPFLRLQESLPIRQRPASTRFPFPPSPYRFCPAREESHSRHQFSHVTDRYRYQGLSANSPLWMHGTFPHGANTTREASPARVEETCLFLTDNCQRLAPIICCIPGGLATRDSNRNTIRWSTPSKD